MGVGHKICLFDSFPAINHSVALPPLPRAASPQQCSPSGSFLSNGEQDSTASWALARSHLIAWDVVKGLSAPCGTALKTRVRVLRNVLGCWYLGGVSVLVAMSSLHKGLSHKRLKTLLAFSQRSWGHL